MSPFPNTIYLYGPQTVGKSSRLLKIIEHDQGDDLAFSGEDNFIDNGKFQTPVTAPLPNHSNLKSIDQFRRQIKSITHSRLIKHILIDGAQFIPIDQIQWLQRLFNEQYPQVPIIFSGCLYYLDINHHQSEVIPSSKFLLQHCSKVISVKRHCDFCQRNASRLWIKNLQINTHHTIITQDPHLVCNYHYHVLNLKRNKDRS